MAPESLPESITGGCLCGAIRYKIKFTKEFPWPPTSSTCQCTMCRKWTASLIAQFLVVHVEQFEPALRTFPEYKEFSSSANRYRGFCGKCGTSLIWRSDDKKEMFDMYLGTIDEEHLLGDKEVGEALARPSGTQFWMENAIKGVTDLVQGGKIYLREGHDGLQTSDHPWKV